MNQNPKSEIPLTFTFTESESKLHIKAQVESNFYAGDIDSNPAFDFAALKDALTAQQFKVITKTNEIIKLRIGFLNIEMKSQERVIIAEMKEKIKKFQDQLMVGMKKNSELEHVIKKQDENMKRQDENMKKQDEKIKEQDENMKKQDEVIKQQEKKIHSLTERLSQIEQTNRIIETINLIKNNIFSMTDFHTKSKVIKKSQEMETIEEFFSPQRVSHIQMLYRASENEFCAYEFHARCNFIPNTLTLCETEFGKKIGGYTPIPWCSAGATRADPTGKSFIFSLANKDKFLLNQYQKAICDHSSYGPTFGNGNDLHICDQANTSNCHSYINYAYRNNKYTKGNGSSWQRFNGNAAGSNGGQHFKLKEWQVWRVIFEESEQMQNN